MLLSSFNPLNPTIWETLNHFSRRETHPQKPIIFEATIASNHHLQVGFLLLHRKTHTSVHHSWNITRGPLLQCHVSPKKSCLLNGMFTRSLDNPLPIGSLYGIYLYIYCQKSTIHGSANIPYMSYMDPMSWWSLTNVRAIQLGGLPLKEQKHESHVATFEGWEKKLIFLMLYQANKKKNQPHSFQDVFCNGARLVFSCLWGKMIFKKCWILKNVRLQGKRGKRGVRYLVLNHWRMQNDYRAQ